MATISRVRTSGGLTGANGQLSIAGVLDDFNNARTAANTANTSRYNQGLAVLNKSAKVQGNLFGQATAEADKQGGIQYADAAQTFKNDTANTANTSVNRGLGNFTITDALQHGNENAYAKSKLAIGDTLARNKQGALQAQGNAAMGAGGNIAGFIANRNDVAPSIGEYAGLIAQAAQGDAAGQQRTGTVISPSFNAPIAGTSAAAGSSGGGLTAVNGGTTGASGGYYSASQAAGIGGAGGGGGGSGGGSGGYYGGSASVMPSPIADASGGGGGFSPGMAAAGYGAGSISINPAGVGAVGSSTTNSAGTTATRLPDAPAAGSASSGGPDTSGYEKAIGALRASQGIVYDSQYNRLKAQFGIA